MFLDKGFTADGAVRLVGAHIRGQLVLRGAQINGADNKGNSLVADGLQIDSTLHLDKDTADDQEPFTAAGAIRLVAAHITGQLILTDAQLTGTNNTGTSLVAESLQVDTSLMLDGGFTAAGTSVFASAQIGNLVVSDDRDRLPRLGEMTGCRLQDVHGAVRGNRAAAASWLDSAPEFVAQPWQELATVYERNGQPADARWVRYQAAVRSTRNTKSRWARAGRHTYRFTTGHGYYPLVALGWLSVILITALGFSAVWADEFMATSRAVPGANFNPIVYALTTAFPAAADAQLWQPPDDYRAGVIYGLRLMAWVFTAVLLAGVTGLLRRQT